MCSPDHFATPNAIAMLPCMLSEAVLGATHEHGRRAERRIHSARFVRVIVHSIDGDEIGRIQFPMRVAFVKIALLIASCACTYTASGIRTPMARLRCTVPREAVLGIGRILKCTPCC